MKTGRIEDLAKIKLIKLNIKYIELISIHKIFKLAEVELHGNGQRTSFIEPTKRYS